ncbi:hypothetical protein [Aquimonas sp.]
MPECVVGGKLVVLGVEVPRLILQGDICRRELAVEIDGFHA